MKDFVEARGLHVIQSNEWHVLRDLFKSNWPKNILVYYTLQNYIDWFAKNPAMDDVAIYSIDSDWRRHGTFILEDRNELRYNVLFHTLYVENQGLMLAALQRLETSPTYTLTSYAKLVEPAVLQHLRKLGISNLVKGLYSTVLFYMPKAKCLELELKPLEGFITKHLTQAHGGTVDNLWPHQHPGSDYYIERLIKYNLSFGIFEAKSNELCAWALQSENGTIGLLQVKDEYKRRGFGEYLVRFFARTLAERGLDATATVLESNAPSRRLFQNIGFEIIDNIFWYDKEAIDCDKEIHTN